MPSLGASKVPQITAQSYDAHKVWRGKLLLTNLWSKENIVFIVHRYNMQHRVQEQGTQWAVSFRTGKEETHTVHQCYKTLMQPHHTKVVTFPTGGKESLCRSPDSKFWVHLYTLFCRISGSNFGKSFLFPLSILTKSNCDTGEQCSPQTLSTAFCPGILGP